MAPLNRLAGETSPYLTQHAANPVDWWPWCDDAFAEARRRDVPVLISVGYSACHWCHVMAHESFEDSEVAATLNASFVPVKVDREERPDIDAVYMEAVQLVNGSGGWPMTVLATADGRPFWAGTYLPKASFLRLLAQVARLWATKRAGVEDDASRLAEAIRNSAQLPSGVGGRSTAAGGGGAGAEVTEAGGRPVTDDLTALELFGVIRQSRSAGAPGREALALAAEAVLARHDAEWGGSAGAPKFPQPASLEVLARHWWRSGETAALLALRRSLDAMSSGGIYDHLAGGFARYSTDRYWLVPHFEKMLYDNALLVKTYTHAWQLSGSPRYRQVVEETVRYLLSPPLRLPEGAWASAEDADSEGEEGRFYTWSQAEVNDVAGPAVADWYGVSGAGNWDGKNVLWRPGLGDLARPAEIEEGRRKLLERRSQRVRPSLDAKVLTEWNAMAVAALAYAGTAFGQPAWVRASAATAELLLARLRRADGRWLRSWRPQPDGGDTMAAGGRHLACAGDYAWLVEAFTRLGEATGRRSWVDAAAQAAGRLTDLFWDKEQGGFFTSGSDAEELIARMKDLYDGAVPSVNAVAASALARLGELTGERDFTEIAEQTVQLASPALQRAPAAFPATALVADYLSWPRREVVITSSGTDLLLPVRARYLPDTVLAWGEPYGTSLWEGRDTPENAGQAFVCQGYTCGLPVREPAELAALLDERPR